MTTPTQEDVIRWAREAGMKLSPAQFSGVLECETDEFQLAEFATLVAAAEREACAALCADTFYGNAGELNHELAAAIRARGQA